MTEQFVRNKTSTRWKPGTAELSGGQKTLLGLAMIAALATYRPSPLYVLDECDAALDEENQMKVAALVAQVLVTQCRCQIIAISHHAEFQRKAQRTIEIAKRGCDSVLTDTRPS